jgi:glyoxylase-like metal-dependent hydrolase (beta-lactamase superfamily II)
MSIHATFRTGNIECAVVRYSETAGPPAYLFPDVPANERDAACARHLIDGGNLGLVYSSLLLRRDEQVIVVDAGPGGPHDALGDALGAIGAEPGSVRHVILSHAHPDHVGGLVAGGDKQPRFSGAAHHLLVDEWSHWMESDDGGAMTTQTRASLEPIGTAELVEIHDDEIEIVPGVILVPTPGHTPGHLSVIVRDRGETLVYLGDVVTHSVMIEHPGWHSVFDTIPGTAASTRRRMIQSAEVEGAVIVASHIPLPGRIIADPQSGRTFAPLEHHTH